MNDSTIKIGIDIDNTINVSEDTIKLFSFLTHCLRDKAEIHIITSRNPSEESRRETILELKDYNVYYDALAITDDKSNYIMENGITVFIDDTDEFFANLPESVTVFKIREPGNFDFDQHKWVYGNKTGINIDVKKGK